MYLPGISPPIARLDDHLISLPWRGCTLHKDKASTKVLGTARCLEPTTGASQFTDGPKAEQTACRGPAHTEILTAYPVRLAERTAVEAALRARVEAGQAAAAFLQDSLLDQTVTG